MHRRIMGLLVLSALCATAADAQTVAGRIEPTWDAEKGLYTYGPLYWDLQVAPSSAGSDEFGLYLYYNKARALMAVTVACRGEDEDFTTYARSFFRRTFPVVDGRVATGRGVRIVPRRRQRPGRRASVPDGGLGARDAPHRSQGTLNCRCSDGQRIPCRTVRGFPDSFPDVAASGASPWPTAGGSRTRVHESPNGSGTVTFRIRIQADARRLRVVPIGGSADSRGVRSGACDRSLMGATILLKLTCHAALRHIRLRRASRLREAGRRLSRPGQREHVAPVAPWWRRGRRRHRETLLAPSDGRCQQ